MNRGPETIVQSLPQADDGTAPGGPTSGHDDEMTRHWEGGPEALQAGTTAATLSPGSGETLPGASHVPGSGRMAGRYQILERLGRGGMATVYRAHDPTIGRDVAIKFLHASLCEDAGYRARFLREARAAGGLQHPNIVVVHDVGEIDGRPYMAMELLEGDTLSAVMESAAGGLPLRDVTVMGIQLARALDYAHQRRIVHRDIKPGNICRLRTSQTVKVMDFGIAHMESSGTEMRTRVGDVLGTPQYMSPEQTRGERLDGRSDLFSVGIVMYQALAGQRPFQADSLVALAVKIAKDEPPPLDKARPDVPASLRRVVERCLAKAPDRRFQTGADLSEALSRVLAEIDETALARSRNPRVSLRVKWAGTMALIVAVVMAFTASLITSRQHAAMMRQVTETGASLARFIAAQNASAALYGDWEWDKSQALLQRMMETRDFHSITLVDQGGIVRASSITSLIGQPYKAPVAEPVGSSAGEVAITRFSDGGESVLGFSAPITFQTKRVGAVALGLPERPLTQVAQLANVLMLVLVVVTVLAVAIAMYFVANWFARPIRELSDAMREIGKGRFDYRIAQQRNDEFGLLYAAFDQMAQQLADRQSGASPPTQAPIAPGSESDTDSTEGLSQPSDEPTQPRTLVAPRSGARSDAPGDSR
jgi:eukaryotic-like serine/threonine-protein kinase